MIDHFKGESYPVTLQKCWNASAVSPVCNALCVGLSIYVYIFQGSGCSLSCFAGFEGDEGTGVDPAQPLTLTSIPSPEWTKARGPQTTDSLSDATRIIAM